MLAPLPRLDQPHPAPPRPDLPRPGTPTTFTSEDETNSSHVTGTTLPEQNPWHAASPRPATPNRNTSVHPRAAASYQ